MKRCASNQCIWHKTHIDFDAHTPKTLALEPTSGATGDAPALLTRVNKTEEIADATNDTPACRVAIAAIPQS